MLYDMDTRLILSNILQQVQCMEDGNGLFYTDTAKKQLPTITLARNWPLRILSDNGQRQIPIERWIAAAC